MTLSYTPQAGGLAARLCAWFQANRDEELSRADIAKKFEVPASSIDGLLGQCFAHGLLNRAKDDEGGAIVVAGGRLKDLVLVPSIAQLGASTLAGAVKRTYTRRGPRVALPPLDFAALKVEAGIPIPPKAHGVKKGETKYDSLFGALKPNESVAVPRQYAAALKKASTVRMKRAGGKFAVRIVSETEARLWRTE